MKIAILGGGITGLMASYCLVQKGHSVTIFEKEDVLGGLAAGFKRPHWEWYIERAYHHLFATDTDILNFSKEIGFNKIFFSSPETASLYDVGDTYMTFPLDTPFDFLQFPLLSYQVKFRAAAVLLFLKLSPFLTIFERQTAEQFLRRFQGAEAWNVLWKELFRKKFGKYAEKVLATFMWARIKKRTKNLGYIHGGFQTFIDYLESINNKQKVEIRKGITVESIVQRGAGFGVRYSDGVTKRKRGEEVYFDAVISTLPTAIMTKITQTLFSDDYLNRFAKLNYMHALVLILETEEPILDKTYWLNICSPKLPLMFVGQHTNLVDKKYYGGNHLAYVGYYLERDDPLMKMEKEELETFLLPHLRAINPKLTKIVNSYLFKAPFAQPIFDSDFVKNKPDFETPLKNFFIANLDMTYPYDRGTNYAVKLGKAVGEYFR